MLERLYYYRGFEIGVQPQLVKEPAQLPVEPVRYRCVVHIRRITSVLRLDSFALEYSGNVPFEDEFHAVLNGCYAAEHRINLHCAISANEPHLVDVAC